VGLSLTVLGCSGGYPGRGASCSGYLVQGGGVNVIVDLGPGSLANLQRHLDLGSVDAVVLTHRHPDHWTDLTGLEVAWAYGLERTGLDVYGTAETGALAEALTGGLAPTMVWHDLTDGDQVEIGGLRLRFARTVHYVETLAVRIDDIESGSSLAYSADTGPGWSFESLGPDIDLALCEATHLVSDESRGILHLSARQAGVMARSAGVSRLLLTHQWPEYDPEQFRIEGSEAFGAPVEIAITNGRYDL
jgi:ribonuclease BN (tRNA processing enzyme)